MLCFAPAGALPRARRILAAVAFGAAVALMATPLMAQEPPSEPPADWGPVSINMEDVSYPHPVSYVKFSLYGKDVRMAFMGVTPDNGGNGQTVVLLHGGNYWAAAWESVIDRLVDAGFRVVAMDQIGYGRSSKPIIPYSLDMHAGNIARVLDELEIERTAIFGHSYGGMKASRFAFLYPERTSHVGLVNAIGLADGRAGQGWSEPSPDLDRGYEAIVDTVRGYVARWDDAYLDYVRIHYGWGLSGEWPCKATVRARNFDVVRTTTVVHDWPQIEAPALVIGGELDGPDYPELATSAAESFQDGEVVLFPGIGHNPHWESPEELTEEIIRFLSR